MTQGRAEAGRSGGDRRRPICRSAARIRTKASPSTARDRSTSTSAHRPTPASRRIGGRKCPARIRARCSRSRAASGSSTRTSSDRQQADGTRYATGMRQMPAITWHDGALYVAMNSRDQLDTLWPELFTAEDNAERPAEPLYRVDAGRELRLAVLLLRLRPEQAAAESRVRRRRQDGRTLRRVHRADRDVPGALGAGRRDVLHGHAVSEALSGRRLHRVPRIVESLADAAGRLQRDVPAVCRRQAVGQSSRSSPTASPARDRSCSRIAAVARADGVAQAPDGSLYIADSVKGRIWRVIYTGK